MFNIVQFYSECVRGKFDFVALGLLFLLSFASNCRSDTGQHRFLPEVELLFVSFTYLLCICFFSFVLYFSMLF